MNAPTLPAAIVPGPFDTWLAGLAQDLPGAGLGWLSAQRGAALARARAAGVPTSKQEGWRYTGLKSLLEQGFIQGVEEVTGLAPEDVEDLLIPGLDAHRVVLANGRLVPSLSWVDGFPGGVRAGGLRDPDRVRARPAARAPGAGGRGRGPRLRGAEHCGYRRRLRFPLEAGTRGGDGPSRSFTCRLAWTSRAWRSLGTFGGSG